MTGRQAYAVLLILFALTAAGNAAVRSDWGMALTFTVAAGVLTVFLAPDDEAVEELES